MATGQINVSVENIFPLIKKFLYSDHEIFLRELISNGTDATLKLKHLTSIGEAKVEYGNPILEVKIDKEGKKLHIIDQGIGMTANEVEKYINQIAFSGAERIFGKIQGFCQRLGIIGHFGLGFYFCFLSWLPKLKLLPNHTKQRQPTGFVTEVQNSLWNQPTKPLVKTKSFCISPKFVGILEVLKLKNCRTVQQIYAYSD